MLCSRILLGSSTQRRDQQLFSKRRVCNVATNAPVKRGCLLHNTNFARFRESAKDSEDKCASDSRTLFLRRQHQSFQQRSRRYNWAAAGVDVVHDAVLLKVTTVTQQLLQEQEVQQLEQGAEERLAGSQSLPYRHG